MFKFKENLKHVSFMRVMELLLTVLVLITAFVIVRWVIAGASPFVLLMLIPLVVASLNMWKETLVSWAWARRLRSLIFRRIGLSIQG